MDARLQILRPLIGGLKTLLPVCLSCPRYRPIFRALTFTTTMTDAVSLGHRDIGPTSTSGGPAECRGSRRSAAPDGGAAYVRDVHSERRRILEPLHATGGCARRFWLGYRGNGATTAVA